MMADNIMMIWSISHLSYFTVVQIDSMKINHWNLALQVCFAILRYQNIEVSSKYNVRYHALICYLCLISSISIWLPIAMIQHWFHNEIYLISLITCCSNPYIICIFQSCGIQYFFVPWWFPFIAFLPALSVFYCVRWLSCNTVLLKRRTCNSQMSNCSYCA